MKQVNQIWRLAVTRTGLRRAAAALVACGCLSPVGAKTVSLRFGAAVDVPAAGIRLRPFSGCTARPLPLPKAVTYTNRQTGEKVETYDPRALWLRDQTSAFLDGPTATIVIGRLRHPPPTDDLPLINGKHVREADFRAARDARKVVWTVAVIRQWVEAFTGWRIRRARNKLRGLLLNDPYLVIDFADRDPTQTLAFVLLMPGRPTFLLVDFKPGTQVRHFATTILRLVNSVKPIRTQDIVKRPDRRMQNRDMWKQLGGRRSAEGAAARQRVIDSIRNLEDWWYVETPNYVLTSNLSKRNRRLVDLIQDDVEALRAGYARLFPPVKEMRDVSVIRMFATRAGYQAYVDPEMKWSTGIWTPSRKELVIASLDDVRTTRQLREQVLTVVYHEGFHQYLYYALDQAEPPIWFNEGHAAFFEASDIDHDTGRLRVRENAGRVRWLERALAEPRQIDLPALMRMSRSDFYALAAGKGAPADAWRQRNYALAWGLVYFLRKGAGLYPKRGYDRLCDAVVGALVESGDWRRASEAGLSTVRPEQLQRDFIAFWQSRRQRGKAERNLIFR